MTQLADETRSAMPDPLTGRASAWRGRAWLAALTLLSAVLVLVAGTLARREAARSLYAQAEAGLPLAVAALRSELEKQRSLPLVLSGDASVKALLSERAPTQEALAAENERLAQLTAAARAAVIYILDRDGIAIASSNFREPTSFVGSDYRFRRYYEGAVEAGAAEQYALGTVSNRPGVYFSRRVSGADGALLGVVVVKVELDGVEEDWREAGRPVYVTDERGIVLSTTVPDWRFRTLQPIAPGDAAEIRDSLQFGAARLDALPVHTAGSAGGVPLVTARFDAADTGKAKAEGFVVVSSAVVGGLAGWRLFILQPADRALLAAATLAQLVTALVLLVLVLVSAAVLYRARRAQARLGETRAFAERLERRVGERTAALTEANGRLIGEMAERAKAEARIVTLREDLIQANRLASLGQITAGVAHEINQPLAAIRTYAENAGRFLARGDIATTNENLGIVVGLTERIGTITETLRGFARRASGPAEALAIAEPVEGALLIMKSRLEGRVRLVTAPVDQALIVRGNRIRLEQVLVNLLRNALEALAETPEPEIVMSVEALPQAVRVHVRDNGPGIAPDILAKLFTPFSTSKPKGLGLGLVISSDILAELGGTLSAENAAGGGAHFTLTLKRMEPSA